MYRNEDRSDFFSALYNVSTSARKEEHTDSGGKDMDQKSRVRATKTLLDSSGHCQYFQVLGCQGNDGAGHILLECTHADMKKQQIARHDAMMRMLISCNKVTVVQRS